MWRKGKRKFTVIIIENNEIYREKNQKYYKCAQITVRKNTVLYLVLPFFPEIFTIIENQKLKFSNLKNFLLVYYDLLEKFSINFAGPHFSLIGFLERIQS